MVDKKVINYYASFYDVSKDLNENQFYQFNMAIFKVMFYEEHINNIQFEDKILSLLWKSIKHSLEASINGYCGKKNIPYDEVLSIHSKGVAKVLTNNAKVKGKVKGNKEAEAYPLLVSLLKESPEYEQYLEIVKDFIQYRKSIKSNIKTTLPIKSYIKALQVLQEKGLTFEYCINKMKESEWQTVKEHYFSKDYKATNETFNTLEKGKIIVNDYGVSTVVGTADRDLPIRY